MKKQTSVLLLSIILIVTFAISSVSSHVPVDVANNSQLNEAKPIENPTKSWAIYTQLPHSEDVGYYSFNINKGETIFIQLFVTTRSNEVNFLPAFALMSTSLTGNDSVPDNVATVGGVMLVSGERSNPTYESFGPSHFVEISQVKIAAPETGIYYIAVFSNSGAGHYGLAIGTNESFTIEETIMNPINVINVYLWQGESWLIILLPYILTIGVVGIFYLKFVELPTNLQKFMFWLSTMYISSSVSFAFQTIYNVYFSELSAEVAISLVIVLLQALIGAGILTLASSDKLYSSYKKQTRLLILSLLSLMLWVGLIVAPVISILLAIYLLVRKRFESDISSTTT